MNAMIKFIVAMLIPVIAGELIEPPPRAIPEDFRRRLPPKLRNLSDRELHRLPVGYVHKQFGPDAARLYSDFSGSCGGIPGDPRKVERASLGRPFNFVWDIDRSEGGGQCRLLLSCPGKLSDRDLWKGGCRDVRRYSQSIVIPKDIGPRRAGDCHVEWSLDSLKGEHHSNCVDIEIA